MDKMRIMLVDDEEGFLFTTKKLLERKGIQVITAASGHEALEKLVGESVHVVILDVKMPGMDGVAVLKAVKSRYPLVQVVMLTGHGTVESALEGLRSGATDYLMKPIEPEELSEIVSHLAENLALRRQMVAGEPIVPALAVDLVLPTTANATTD